MIFLIIVINTLLASFKLYEFFTDYKNGEFFTASIELVLAIILITCGVCATWNSTLQLIT